MGMCKFGEPATVTIANGISTQLYGSWLQAEYNDNLLFFNLLEKDNEQWKAYISRREKYQKIMEPSIDTYQIYDTLGKELGKRVEDRHREK